MMHHIFLKTENKDGHLEDVVWICKIDSVHNFFKNQGYSDNKLCKINNSSLFKLRDLLKNKKDDQLEMLYQRVKYIIQTKPNNDYYYYCEI